MKQFVLYLFLIQFSISFAQSKNEVQPFLKDIISQFPNVRDTAISVKKNEVVFSAQSVIGDVSALVTSKKTDNGWSSPEIVSFSGQYFDIEPFFSTDALKLYFASNRPLNENSEDVKDFDIWYVERSSIEGDWSKPINIGAPVNTAMDEFYPVITDSNNLYFTLDNRELKRKDDIYISEYVDGEYTTPKALGDGVNSVGYEFNAFVSNDESFIIYTCYNRKDGFGSGDLYISYKSKDGKWSPAKNMGAEVNSNKMDYCPFVDLESQTLYFSSKRIINPYPANTKINMKALQSFFNSYSNGSCRLYRVSFNHSKAE